MSTSQTGIAVTAKILFLNFVMLLFKPVVEIDGVVHEGAWSSVYFSTAPSVKSWNSNRKSESASKEISLRSPEMKDCSARFS